MNGARVHVSSADTLLGALLFLMSAYQRRPCRCLASCIAQHCRHLSAHPDAGRNVRQVVGVMAAQWQKLALSPEPSQLRH